MGKKLPNAPKIFNVNWFRTDDNGRFLWPGFGDNLRVLEWILKRCFDDAGSWRENCAGIREYFEQFGDKLPHELRDELEALEKAFAE